MAFLKSPVAKRILVIIGAIIVLAVGYVWMYNYTGVFTRRGDFAAGDSIQRVDIEIKNPVVMYGMIVDSLHVTEDVVKKNQRFTDLLSGYYVSPIVQQQLVLLDRK